ncbi:MAG: recombinase family protein [Candidatus Berkelbacteria bacterium]|nr:recombinase family protein [Candidatus Berkelbacteria bacterium]
MNNQNKFFLYARKSTDVEDKQILSIEAQITELRAFAKQENLNIVETFIEKQSAKIPGRHIFGKMIKRIEKGEADGILAWHPFMSIAWIYWVILLHYCLLSFLFFEHLKYSI